MTWGGILNVKNWGVKLYPPEVDPDNTVIKPGGILGGFDTGKGATNFPPAGFPAPYPGGYMPPMDPNELWRAKTALAHFNAGESLLPPGNNGLGASNPIAANPGRRAGDAQVAQALGERLESIQEMPFIPPTGTLDPNIFAQGGPDLDRLSSEIRRATAKPVGIGGGFAQGFMDMPLGTGQLIANAGAFSESGKAVADRINEQQRLREEDYRAGRAAAGRDGFDFARTAGRAVSGLALAPLLPEAATLAGATAIGAAGGAIQGALSPVEVPNNGSYWEEKIQPIKQGLVQGSIEDRAKFLGKRAIDWMRR